MSLTHQVPKKKKKSKARDRQPPTKKVRVLARPKQPLGTSFEYDPSARAMCVTEFVSPDSVVLRGGVKVGMYLTEVDDLSVVGLKQDDVVFMLQRKAASLRELLFEAIKLPSCHEQDSSALRSHSANNDRVSLFPNSPTPNPTSVSTAKNDNNSRSSSIGSDDTQQLPVLRSPTSSNSPLQSKKLQQLPSSTITTSPASSSPSPSLQPPRRRKSQDLQKAISSASQTSYAHMMQQGATSTSSSQSGRGLASHSSSLSTAASTGTGTGPRGPKQDPFSTPARRRRLVADVARFLLKQYCTQACVLVHSTRLRNRSATVIQCLFRCYSARRLLRMLLFKRHTAAAIRIQALCRRLAAQRIRKKLWAQYRLKVTSHLALCLQCLSRVRRSHQVVVREREEQTTLARGIQRLVRGRLGRKRARHRQQALDRQRRAKEQASLRLQCRHRRRMALRVLEHLRQVHEQEMCMSSRIALRWRRRCHHRVLAATCIQRVGRGWRGRRVARVRRHEEHCRKAEERAMGLEDHNASLLRAQHRVEIRVDLSPSLLNSLKRCKISTLIKWCIEQSVLHYDEAEGEGGCYSMGDVIRQVLRATHTPHETPAAKLNPALGNTHRARHVELQSQEATASREQQKDDRSLDIKQSGEEKHAIQLPTSDQGYPSRFNGRYTLLPGTDATQVHTQQGRPLTLHVSSPQEGGCVCMHLEPVFRSFALESERLRRNQLQRGAGAPIDNPLLCPNLSSCDVHIILGTDTIVNSVDTSSNPGTSDSGGGAIDSARDSGTSTGARARARAKGNTEDNASLGDKYVGIGCDESKTDSDEEEMLKFRFKDVSVSVSVTTIVSGDDTTECLVNTKKKREAEEAERTEKERQEKKAKELADLEATKALVAEINAAEKERLEMEMEKEIEMEAKQRAEKEAATAAAAAVAAAEAAAKLRAASASGKRSRPNTATKRIKVSVIDEDAREQELLRKRLAEEAAERLRRLEAERLAAEQIRLARLQAIREKAAVECVQRHYRAHLLFTQQKAAASVLQGCVRRWVRLRRWWWAVRVVSRLMHFAAVSMQKRLRGHQARQIVLLKRLDACSNEGLQAADHWMNMHVLGDYGFALGRSFISEGRRGYVIGGDNDDLDINHFDSKEEEEAGNESVVNSEDESSDEDEDEDEDGDDSSEDEEDYIINQRLNKHKNTENDFVYMENFVHKLFSLQTSATATSSDPTTAASSSVVCCCSLEELTTARGQKSDGVLLPAVLQSGGAGQWAAQLMALSEFLPPPPFCVKPRDVLLRVPSPPPLPQPRSTQAQASGSSSPVAAPARGAGVSSAVSRNDGGDVLESFMEVGDLCGPLDPRVSPALSSSGFFTDLHCSALKTPQIYSTGIGGCVDTHADSSHMDTDRTTQKT